ncbi:Ornithine cyclodeaminase/mu-crystallin family [Sulfidibacter corallicola]|uniref:Ornithine cyclodeaminase n=1 Tax=Sulfidibacter corallicola TaxID=2818388 RepID=A0A8A4TVW7_SULCO|nr:hypothetical protein [Sulfidibacter corallicola]QTD50675.1 hypothetical protein J3U87_34245 [Sulfidibacter corallicola]
MHVYQRDQIEAALSGADVVAAIEAGFRAMSRGEAVIPPVGEMVFDRPPGEVHIKYGYLRGDDFYLVKVASGFYENPQRGLPSSSGLMLLFRRETGQLAAVLNDEGFLTDLRTAAAGAVAAKLLAPKRVDRIGVLGTGTQARLQLRMLAEVTTCREVLVWGRDPAKAAAYRHDLEPMGFRVEIADTTAEVATQSDLIVTTTPSHAPLIYADQLKPGTHITAVGADTPGKRELAPEVLARADLVAGDRLSQCITRGEIAHGLRTGCVCLDDCVELGDLLLGSQPGRPSPRAITVADLTGVAVQDIQIAKLAYRRLREREGVRHD